ncbi:unnamed protein product, partial [Polarella glacialis]
EGKLEAEALSYQMQRGAKAKVEAKAKHVEGQMALITAEGAASGAMAASRQQEQELLRLEILKELANNPHVKVVTSLENNSGLAPENSLVAQMAQQGMEAFRMKLAEMTSSSVAKLEMGKVFSGGLVRPVPLQMKM